MADQEPYTGPPNHQQVHESENTGDSPPLGLKPGLLAGVPETVKFWIYAGIGILVVSFVFAMVYGSAINAGLLSTEGSDAGFTVLSWLALIWLFGQWLKARFGRPNKIFREQ